MGIINVAGRVSGRKYPINIAGDVPDEIERGRIASSMLLNKNKRLLKNTQLGLA
jgi:hypothetical protein